MKLIVFLISTQICFGSFSHLESDPVDLVPYSRATGHPAPLHNLGNPAFLPYTTSYFLTASYARPYGIEGLHSTGLHAGHSWHSFSLAAAWRRFGTSGYYEDRFEQQVAYVFSNFIQTGISAHIQRLSIASTEYSFHHNSANADLALVFMPWKPLIFGIRQDNIYSLYEKELSDLSYPAFSIGSTLRIIDGVFISYNYTKTYYGPLHTYEISINLLPQCSLATAYSRETETYASAISIFLDRYRVSYGFRFHPLLGTTHMMGLGYSGVKIWLPPIKYQQKKKHYRKDQSGNRSQLAVQRCTEKDIIDKLRVAPRYARRIIAYRTHIGPVSEKSLLQIGLSPEEVKTIKKYITDLYQPPKREKHASQKQYLLSDTQRRKFFGRLIEAGIPYTKALYLCQKTRHMSLTHLLRSLDRWKMFTSQEKRIIRKLCKNKL